MFTDARRSTSPSTIRQQAAALVAAVAEAVQAVAPVAVDEAVQAVELREEADAVQAAEVAARRVLLLRFRAPRLQVAARVEAAVPLVLVPLVDAVRLLRLQAQVRPGVVAVVVEVVDKVDLVEAVDSSPPAVPVALLARAPQSPAWKSSMRYWQPARTPMWPLALVALKPVPAVGSATRCSAREPRRCFALS